MGECDERAARNEIVFRAANEKIERAASEYGAAGLIPFICECSDARCTHITPLTLEEYAEVREGAGRFFVAPGHEQTGASDLHLVRSTDRFSVVERRGADGTIEP